MDINVDWNHMLSLSVSVNVLFIYIAIAIRISFKIFDKIPTESERRQTAAYYVL